MNAAKKPSNYFLFLFLPPFIMVNNLCNLPSNPDNPANTTLSLILEASGFQKSDSSVTDTVGKTIRIGLCLGVKKYIDSINVTIGSSEKVDSVIELGKGAINKDTIFCEMFFSNAGTRTVSAIAYVGNEFRKESAKIHIIARPVPNRKPTLTISGEKEVAAGERCTLIVSVDDPDSGQSYTIDSTEFPEDSRLVDSQFTWQTTEADTGETSIIFIVQDDGTPSLSDTGIVIIRVKKAVENFPHWNMDTLRITIDEGRSLSLRLADSCANADNESLYFKIPFSPFEDDNLSSEGSYSFTSGFEDSGTFAMEVIVGNDTSADTAVLLIVIHNVNRIPVFPESLPKKSYKIDEGDLLVLPFKAVDADGDEVNCFIKKTDLPRPNEIEVGDSTIVWQSAPGDGDAYTMTLAAFDGSDTGFADIAIAVGDVNLPPRWNADTIYLDGVARQLVSISLADEYSDPDDEMLTVTLLDGSPSGAAVLNDTFSFTPTDDGIFYSYVSVTDSSEASDTLVIQLTIIPADTLPPVLKLISLEDSAEISASSAQIKISATDESGVQSVICISGSDSFPVTRSDSVFTSTVTGLLHNTFSTFTFIATDSSFFANSCTLLVSVKYDSTLLDGEGPVIIQTNGPISGIVLTDPAIIITDSIIDPSGVDSVCWTLNGVYVDDMTKLEGSMVSYRLRDTLENYRVNRVVIHAWDNATGRNHDSSVVLIDYNIPPVVNDTAFSTARNTTDTWTMNARSEDSDPLVWKQITVPSSLHFAVSGNLPDITVTPATNWAGTDSFFVTVTDGYWVDTSKIVMTVENTLVAPKILTQPSGSTKYAGQSISFSVTINPDVNPAPAYQWKHDGDNLPGAIASSYNIGTIAESDSGLYTVTITNSVGNVTSQPARLVVLPAGMRKIMASGNHFQMGQAGFADTVHRVEFTYDFFIDTTEVTQEDYLDIMGINPSNPSNDLALPVQRVTWFDAVLYCNNRSKRYGKDTVYTYTSITGIAGNGCSAIANLVTHYDRNGFRLPTEAEWEYACRGGTGLTYFWGNDTDSVVVSQYAWWMGSIKVVAQKLPNGYGLYDMSGNVWEYCNDQYDDYPVPVYGSSTQTDPHGPATGSARAVRGGSWYSSYITEFGSATRKFFVPQGVGSFTGFRAVLPIN
jgi:formylglycine-generating enzyme required for sulfatase activity